MLNLGIGRRWKTRKKPDILVHIKICKYRCFSHHILPEVSASFHKHFFGTTMSQTNTTSNELGYHKLTSLLIDRTLNFQLFINQDDVKLNCILKERYNVKERYNTENYSPWRYGMTIWCWYQFKSHKAVTSKQIITKDNISNLIIHTQTVKYVNMCECLSYVRNIIKMDIMMFTYSQWFKMQRSISYTGIIITHGGNLMSVLNKFLIITSLSNSVLDAIENSW